MSVRKRKSTGKWSFDVRYKTLSGQNKRKEQSGFNSKQEAKDAELKFLISVNEQDNSNNMTIKEICDIYVETKSKSVTKSTMKYTNNIINLHILPHLSKKELREINHQTLLKWHNELANKELSNKRINGVTKKLREIYNFANKINDSNYNPFKAIEKLKEKPKKEIVVYDYPTFKKYEDVIDDFEYKVYFNILYWTGLRSAESWALTWNDFLIETKEVDINKSCIQGIKGIAWEIGPTKTKESNRKILLDNHTFDLLIQLKEIKQNYDGYTEDEFIFGGVEPFRKNTVNSYNKKYANLAEVEYISLHCFRHSHATLIIQKTKDYKMASKRLGHKTEKETIATYSHLIKDSETQLMFELNNLNK
ncbi:tyrosine-type recombinase/integrase [Mycoplasma sp. P36-A1]|uniref:tyrosine-type recombinase/integrase n=1 Tax=Mycoplasma sp. P36-A1 TaxID=3252900 RepID=UPI003C2C6ED4